MDEWWHKPPDFANSVYGEPDAPLAEGVANAIRAFFRDRDDVEAFRDVIEAVAASATARRGRAPDGRPMLRIRVDEPGRGSDHANGLPPQFDPARDAARYGTFIARDLLDSLLPGRPRTITFRPEFSAKLHPAVLWNEYSECLSLDDPDVELSEELQTDLGAWTATEHWARPKPKLRAQGEALLVRVRAEIGERYELVDDWRRDPRD